MSAAAKCGKLVARAAHGAVDIVLMLAVLLLVAVGCYAIWDSRQVFRAADAAKYEIYKPTEEEAEGHSFEELQAINPEVFGWLTVYGTHIDYPLTQSASDMKYINTNALGQYSMSGAIFLGSGCGPEFADFSSIVYGHHMDKQAMFGEIGEFAEKGYFDARRYGMLYYGGREHGLEFFAFIHADAYDGKVFCTGIAGKKSQQAYLDMLLDMATHTRNLSITTDDKIVLLSTCSASSTNGRDILVGRITDQMFEDPFITEETDNRKTPLAVDKLTGLWAGIPPWGRLAMIALLLLLALLLLFLIIRKTRRKRKSDPTRETNDNAQFQISPPLEENAAQQDIPGWPAAVLPYPPPVPYGAWGTGAGYPDGGTGFHQPGVNYAAQPGFQLQANAGAGNQSYAGWYYGEQPYVYPYWNG